MKILKSQKGQGMAEYALILFLIAIVVIVALTNVGNQINAVFQAIAAAL